MYYSKEDLNKILQARDLFDVESLLWTELNHIKGRVLEDIKSSTKEIILFYKEKDLSYIKDIFTTTNTLPKINLYISQRSYLEYTGGINRHPIPYIIVKFEDKYFFILREQGSGEVRLIGKKGLLGGHVGYEGIENGMYRELEEEAKITKDIIKNIELKGLIKSNEGVDQDHLGLVYEVELTTDKIKAEEDGVLTGIWINKENLKNHYSSFENWSKIVYDNLLSK